MKIEEVRGISPSTVQCWSCRNSPILDKEATLGTVSESVKARLESVGENHERRHPHHRVSITFYSQELPFEETSTEVIVARSILKI